MTSTDYGHELLFGTFLTPVADRPDKVVALAQLSEQAGLDLATFQDHPYHPGLLDTWTLLSYVAAATSRIRLAANVLNLPLRQPVVLARSVASLDLLSGGRVELGLGAGAFWDAIAAAGGPRRTAGESVEALTEAIEIIREVWAASSRGGVRVNGTHYQVSGAKRGPAPAHDVGIWVGAYKPRMLRLIGSVADGWLPSLSYLPNGPTDLAAMNDHIDEAAAAVGRDASAIRRLLNVTGQFTPSSSGFLTGPPAQWVEELAALTLDDGISGFVLASDDPTTIERFATEVAPGVRDLVAAERAQRTDSPATSGAAGGEQPTTETPAAGQRSASIATTSNPIATMATAAPTSQLANRRVWDESTRPVAPPAPPDQVYSNRAQAVGRHLVDVHDHLRQELEQVRDLLKQVIQGSVSVGSARETLNQLTMRQNNWTLGAYCAAYCTMVTQHHGLEDRSVFPHLRRADGDLAPVLDRLEDEHVVIHDLVEAVDRALVNLVATPGDFGELQDAVDVLTDALLSHLSYEEQQIVEPLARLGFYPGQM